MNTHKECDEPCCLARPRCEHEMDPEGDECLKCGFTFDPEDFIDGDAGEGDR